MNKIDRATSLDGRVAVVTGGGRGLGRAIGLGLAAAGADVVLAGRSPGPCEDAAQQARDLGRNALALAADVSVPADRATLIEKTVGRFGRIDILVNNAGILKPHYTLQVTEEEFDEIAGVNLKGPVFLSQLAFPYLEASGHGAVVNVSALGAFQPIAGIGAYCAVKAAVANWTSTMAKEWTPRGVRVNALVPGPVATEMILPRDEQKRAAFVADMSASTLFGRLAEPEELVAAVVFLAGDGSSFMSGRSLFMDGGLLA